MAEQTNLEQDAHELELEHGLRSQLLMPVMETTAARKEDFADFLSMKLSVLEQVTFAGYAHA